MNRRIAAVGIFLLLQACASTPPARPMAFWSGRIGLQVHGDPPQNLLGSFELQGSPQSGEFTLMNPIGGIVARLQWTPQQATLERGTERWSRPSLEQLSQEIAQTPLPVSALFDWVQGRAAIQAGWEADLSEHAQGRIVARRLQPEPTAQIRIVLDR